jgi:hypothetical protein
VVRDFGIKAYLSEETWFIHPESRIHTPLSQEELLVAEKLERSIAIKPYGSYCCHATPATGVLLPEDC